MNKKLITQSINQSVNQSICRYGGPGRLKKACIKRQCVVLSQLGTTDGDTKLPVNQSINQSINQTINQSNNLPVAIKSEPTSQVELVVFNCVYFLCHDIKLCWMFIAANLWGLILDRKNGPTSKFLSP